jgi:3-deoxy-D-arabino-heptulosonate 7-phosphate (DAHP) synthase
MTHFEIDNINVSAFDAMPSPEEIHARLPLSQAAAGTVMNGREVLRNILDRRTAACSSSSDRARSTTRSPASTTRAA